MHLPRCRPDNRGKSFALVTSASRGRCGARKELKGPIMTSDSGQTSDVSSLVTIRMASEADANHLTHPDLV